jgi:uncharacterized membrane protein
MEFREVMEAAAKLFEAAGVAIIILGGVYALAMAVAERPGSQAFFDHARRRFGRPLVLGLEVLVAADIIQTITIDPSLDSALVLGILVLVRIGLSFSLDVEIDGMWPWRRAQFEASNEKVAAEAAG